MKTLDGKKETMEKYKGLKIATIYGQSLEGCGVTATTSQLELWGKKNNITVHTYSYIRKYTRSDAHIIDFLSIWVVQYQLFLVSLPIFSSNK